MSGALCLRSTSGVVIGCLTADGHVDKDQTRRLLEAARPMRYAVILSLIRTALHSTVRLT